MSSARPAVDPRSQDHDVFAFEPASLVRSDGSIASSTLEAPGSKSSSRPCRRKRMQFKRMSLDNREISTQGETGFSCGKFEIVCLLTDFFVLLLCFNLIFRFL